jgi:hypothetical protein
MESTEEIRIKRKELFESKYILILLNNGYTISKGFDKKTSRICVYRIEGYVFGPVMYYPLSDKISFLSKGTWYNSGFRWIINNLLYGKEQKTKSSDYNDGR